MLSSPSPEERFIRVRQLIWLKPPFGRSDRLRELLIVGLSRGYRQVYKWLVNGDSSSFSKTGEEWLVSKLSGRLTKVIDVGLNQGRYSLLLLRSNPRTKILGVEAVPSFAEKARSCLPPYVIVERALLGSAEAQFGQLWRKGGGQTETLALSLWTH